jgi:hypothetical protein
MKFTVLAWPGRFPNIGPVRFYPGETRPARRFEHGAKDTAPAVIRVTASGDSAYLPLCLRSDLPQLTAPRGVMKQCK